VKKLEGGLLCWKVGEGVLKIVSSGRLVTGRKSGFGMIIRWVVIF